MMRVGMFFLAGAVALALAGCKDAKDGPAFVLDGALVVFNYRVATANFLVNVKPTTDTNPEGKAIVSFEDPAGGPPIVVEAKVSPDGARVTINSPPVHCIVKDRPYAVSIRIEGQDGALLQGIETTVVSSLDQKNLPDKPLVVGPGYTPNVGNAEGPGGPPVACPQPRPQPAQAG